ncbi:MAG TPA: hypothetical protein VFZ81_02690, partial [Burkholderiales bacterium]
ASVLPSPCLRPDRLRTGSAGDAFIAAMASVLSQIVVIAALEDGREWLSAFVEHLRAQRDDVVQRLSRWPGVTLRPPEGTHVAFANIEALADDAERLCEHFRERARVALVPGASRWFGPGAKGFACDDGHGDFHHAPVVGPVEGDGGTLLA